MLTGEALAAMYASADVFVFPSQSETFGQVVQEAMASGLPSIAQRAGRSRRPRGAGTNRAPRCPGDVAAFADAITDLIADDLGRARMGRIARAVAEHRSWEAINLRISHALAEAVTAICTVYLPVGAGPLVNQRSFAGQGAPDTRPPHRSRSHHRHRLLFSRSGHVPSVGL